MHLFGRWSPDGHGICFAANRRDPGRFDLYVQAIGSDAGQNPARDVSVRFLVFDDEGHGVVKLRNKLVAYPAIIDFLNEHV
jgi:hypothetical protein